MRWRWYWRRRRNGPGKVTACHVRLYTRRGCHLCEEAWQLVKDRQELHGYTMDTEDVDGDPALQRLYGDCVPVITVNGKLRFRGGVSPVLFDRLFQNEADSDA